MAAGQSSVLPSKGRNRMTCDRTTVHNGFTLVEMLVALFVFGLISAAGVTLLRNSADSQIQLREKLSERATLSRLSNLIESDLAQAVSRPIRTIDGTTRPAFLVERDGEFEFSRIGASSDEILQQSSLVRVRYAHEKSAFIRRATMHSDGSETESEAVLIDGLSGMTFKFREASGAWRNDWAATDIKAIPRALEIRLTTKQGLEYRMLYLVGVASPPGTAKDGEADIG